MTLQREENAMIAKPMPPDAVAALKHIVSVYGYIVVAWEHPVKVGLIFTCFSGEWSTEQPFRVVAPASFEEWQGQIEECVRFGYGECRNYLPSKDFFFYRAVTE
jgi:hypothetical protein